MASTRGIENDMAVGIFDSRRLRDITASVVFNADRSLNIVKMGNIEIWEA